MSNVEDLRRPFTIAAVKFKPQTVTQDKSKGLASFYIDSRLLVERLNSVVGVDGWEDSYRLLVEGRDAVALGLPIECSLTIKDVGTRVDVGQIPPGEMDDKAWKSAYSDAFKRAGVKFGVGAYLYNLPNVWAEMKVVNGKAVGFSDNGTRVIRNAYDAWLKGPLNTYGAALDHGDLLADDTPEEKPEPIKTVAPERVTEFEALLAKISKADPDDTHDLDYWKGRAVAASVVSYGREYTVLTEDELSSLTQRLQEAYGKLVEAKDPGGGPSQGNDVSASQEAADAPTGFKAPTTPRGKKAA